MLAFGVAAMAIGVGIVFILLGVAVFSLAGREAVVRNEPQMVPTA